MFRSCTENSAVQLLWQQHVHLTELIKKKKRKKLQLQQIEKIRLTKFEEKLRVDLMSNDVSVSLEKEGRLFLR